MRIRAIVLRALVLAAAAATSCAPRGNAQPVHKPRPEPTIVLDRPSVPPEQFNNREGQDLGPLHNVLRVTERLYSGNSPESDAAFAELQALGVKTIISVDGGRPLVDRAAAYGMRYVHIPVGYDGIDGQTQVLIARACRDLPGPVYLHCHHGKHRGPAAAASAAVILGEMTPEQGVALLKAAKTSPNYPGLYECVSSISPEFRDFVDRAPPATSLPSVATVSGLVANMVGIDFCFENLGHVKKANWTVPKDHPDLVPAAEAGRLADHYRVLMDDPECGSISAEFVALLKRSWEEAQALEDAIVAKKGAERLDALFAAVDQSCRECHNTYRNVKRKK
jgi:protein tyrosine phosphatase (PTP) superfamily phosphohydrolase (DUF442 family)